VCLVGTGPGDPGLLTLHGLQRLRAADTVVYDHLVPRRLLKHARPDAELIDLGTARPNQAARGAIGYLLAEKAREGKLVVRLIAGDPFLFSRGDEEAWYLQEQRVPFEIVPGIPAAIGVSAYAGVPVSRAGAGETVTLVRGSEDESRTPPDVDWAGLARLGGSVVCHAGAQQLPLILDALLAGGWPADTPALAVYNGTLPSQSVVSGTISDLPAAIRNAPRRAPAVLVVGRVAELRERLRWFDLRPLSRRRVLVTRPREQAADLVERLAALGAEPIEAPAIRIAPAENRDPLRRAAAAAGGYDWIVFTSGNAVDAFMSAFFETHRDVRMLKGPRLCAVGPGTADRLERYALAADLVPDEFQAEGVVRSIEKAGLHPGLRVLLPRADIGRDVIADELRRGGAEVEDIVAYRTVVADAPQEGDPDVYRLLLDGEIDVVTFTSGSAVRGFVAMFGAEQAVDLLKHTVVAVIGPTTAQAARRLDIQVTIQPPVSTIPALVDAIAAHFATH
jgi:uroporphyrinogen III methyltransferase/synthase